MILVKIFLYALEYDCNNWNDMTLPINIYIHHYHYRVHQLYHEISCCDGIIPL